MMKSVVVLLSSALVVACALPAPESPQALQQITSHPPTLVMSPYEFTAGNGTKVQAERGEFEVPENRNEPGSRNIKIGFVRFPSTSATPGPPIVYLAGGPGASGVSTAQGPRFSLFMALRELGDVIALDQRGIGMSRHVPVCLPSERPPVSEPLTRASLVAFYRTGVAECMDRWEAGGADIDGYTTLQSAHDIEDLRRALDVPKLNLWGISYGSHLGLAVLKYHPASINRAVLAGIEGLDETVKLPSETDAYFARVQAVIDADPAAKAVYPDLPGLMRRVHAKLNAEPARVEITPSGAAAPVTITFDGFAVQLLASGSIADPSAVRRLPLLYLALDNGQYAQAAQLVHGQFLARPPTFAGMPEAMDLASGVTPARLARLEREFSAGILGDALNFPMPHIAGIRPQIDLGEDFRAPLTSSVPTLFISGTLDGRTYPAEAKATVSGFRNGVHLIVENGGHNIYEADPRIGEAVVAFFRGDAPPTLIRFEPPKIATP